MKKNIDVLIVGSGVAGLYCALNLRKDLNIVVITKAKLMDCNTSLAQGGISTARNINDIPLFIEDTLKAGQYKNSLESVTILAKESIENIDSLIELGMDFDKAEDGSLLYTREGAHSINRIVHAKDTTGKTVEETLIRNVKKQSNVKIYENTTLVDIITTDGCCTGAIIQNNNKLQNINAKVVVLATGGIGGLFVNSTNDPTVTGDSLSIALKHNIKVKDINYIQFHPTALFKKASNNKRFLISEALRGEGAKLYNSKGERFIDELQPRDVVSNAINKEISKSKVPYVYLDISFLDAKYTKNRFPAIYNECLKVGIDLTKEPIPVSPAQHYHMGGIEVDINSCTSLDNLYAIGEVSCTGVHGANRLASNSLLEGLVFSKRAAININSAIDSISLVENISINKSNHNHLYNKEKNKELLISKLQQEVPEINYELFSTG